MPLAKFISKTVYGKDLIYPDCDTSRILANLAGKKTFSAYDLGLIRALGYETRVVGFVPPVKAFDPDEYPAGFVIS